MSEKSKVKEYICLGNINTKGNDPNFTKDQAYTAEEVRRAPKGKKHKFKKLTNVAADLIEGEDINKLKQTIVNLKLENDALKDHVEELMGKEEPEKPQGKAITSATGGQKRDEKL